MRLGVAFGPYDEESRFGLCCPNSPGFREFARAEIEELASGYEFDAFFLDMMFWTGICTCENCQERCRTETSAAIPEIADWTTPAWPRFAEARRRWLAEQYEILAEGVKRHRAIPVFNNSSVIPAGWRAGTGMRLLLGNDLIGGDVQAGPDELLAFGLLAGRLSAGPWQYMHSPSGYLSGAVRSIGLDEQRGHALLATALGGQFMTIDAVQSDGTVHAPTYDTFAEVFAAIKPYEPYLGGTPMADVAVYYSPDADVDLRDNGTPVPALPQRCGFLQPLPHGRAVAGAVGALQRAHLPTGVITSADLDMLDAFRVIVLPNVLRMSDEEVAAFRGYVARGGRLYASGHTSLVGTAGARFDDFALADVFGCSFAGVEPAIVSYLRPARDAIARLIAPAALVPHGATRPIPAGSDTGLTSLLVTAAADATVLATLTLPYGLGRGTREDRQWSSILTSPPWEDTGRPTVVEHEFGAGRAVYASCDLEAGAEPLFAGLIRRLLDGPPSCTAEAPPHVWVIPSPSRSTGASG
ncbi:hypothetical protein ACFQYP_12910 [Nonomuraea antimicrobica]